MEENMKISEEFCGQGNSVSKTLRFELKPENETKEKFDAWIQELENANDINESIKNGNLFAKDKAIFKAYLALKPILDSIHEQFITLALQSDEAKKIDFSDYYEKYIKSEKLDIEEKRLRAEIGKLYLVPAKQFAVIKNGKSNLKESKPYEVLTDRLILSFIEQNITSYTDKIPEEELKNISNLLMAFLPIFQVLILTEKITMLQKKKNQQQLQQELFMKIFLFFATILSVLKRIKIFTKKCTMN